MFECKYCFKKFKLERAFMTHTCTQMERANEIKTSIGQSAYQYYKLWLEKQQRKAPPIETFMTSTYYRSFIKFANHVKRVSIANPDKYIELMCNKKISPVNWDHHDAYTLYLEWNDRFSGPIEQTNISVDTIYKLSEVLDVAPSDIFENLQFGEVFQLLRERKISPWVLLCSKKFKEWLVKQDESNHKDLLRLLGIDYWALKFEKHPDDVKKVKQIVIELGL